LVTPRVPTDARTEYEYLYGERVAIMVDSHIPEAEAEQATLDEIGCLEFWFFTSAFVRTLQKAA
jgi:hypothetical protein